MIAPVLTTRSPVGRISLAGVVLLTASLAFCSTTMAQSGSFLESLFRSIAEKKMQEMRGSAPPTSPEPGQRPGQPPIGFPGGPLGPAPIRPAPTEPVPTEPTRTPESRRQPSRERERPPVTQTIRTSSPEVRDLATQLISFDRELSELLETAKLQSRRERAVRVLLPELYQVQAETRALLGRCDGARSLQPLIGPYQQLDQRYREVSFRLRSLPQRDEQLRRHVSQCDAICRKLTRHCGITPQFDRQGLHDQMVIAATYIQTLIDDLPSARMPTDRSSELVHQGRLLRQAILDEAQHAQTVSYDEIVSTFTEFVSRWAHYADQIEATGDPMLMRRLARISQCGDETYALLWMPPPSREHQHPSIELPGRPRGPGHPSLPGGSQIGREELIAHAASLEGSAEYYRADLARYERYLTPASFRDSLMRNSTQLYEVAKRLHRELDSWQPLDRLQRTTSELASVWQELSEDIHHLDHHGLSDRRAAGIQRQHQELMPIVATLTASLLPLQ